MCIGVCMHLTSSVRYAAEVERLPMAVAHAIRTWTGVLPEDRRDTRAAERGAARARRAAALVLKNKRQWKRYTTCIYLYISISIYG